MDKFNYSNGTLRNKLDVRNAEQLRIYEYTVVSRYSYLYLNQQRIPKSIDDLCKIHLLLFGSIYEWAGEIRDYDLAKGGFHFLEVHALSSGINHINDELKSLPLSIPINRKIYADLLNDLNFLHPFREGNGRSTRLFLQCLAAGHGQVLAYDRSQKDLIDALQRSDLLEIETLIKIEHVGGKELAFRKLMEKRNGL